MGPVWIPYGDSQWEKHGSSIGIPLVYDKVKHRDPMVTSQWDLNGNSVLIPHSAVGFQWETSGNPAQQFDIFSKSVFIPYYQWDISGIPVECKWQFPIDSGIPVG